MAGGSCVPDVIETVACAQARKWAMVKLHLDRLVGGTFTASCGPLQIDDRCLSSLSNAKLILPANVAIEWTMADNSVVGLTGPEIDSALIEIIGFQIREHAASQALRALIYAEDVTTETVAGIDVDNFAWPSPCVVEAPNQSVDDL